MVLDLRTWDYCGLVITNPAQLQNPSTRNPVIAPIRQNANIRKHLLLASSTGGPSDGPGCPQLQRPHLHERGGDGWLNPELRG